MEQMTVIRLLALAQERKEIAQERMTPFLPNFTHALSKKGNSGRQNPAPPERRGTWKIR
jgi:hypothetical protein